MRSIATNVIRNSIRLPRRARIPGLASLRFAVLSITGIALTVSSPSASATEMEVFSCPQTVNITYSPGLTYTDQTIQLTSANHLGVAADQPIPCTSTNALRGITAGSGLFTDSATFSCVAAPLLRATSGTRTILWSNGTSTTYASTANQRLNLLGQLVVTNVGSVVAGEFMGGTVTFVGTATSLNWLDCATPEGLTSLTLKGTFTITNPTDSPSE